MRFSSLSIAMQALNKCHVGTKSIRNSSIHPSARQSRLAMTASPVDTKAATQIVPTLSHVLASRKYDALLLDQFGVLHDGKKPYPQAIEAVRQAANAGLRIFIVSNSSRRSSGTFKKLEKLGFKADWFAGAVTSGELTHLNIVNRPDEWWQKLGHKVLHFTWSSRGTVDLTELQLAAVDSPQEADFIVAHGTEAVGRPSGQPAQDMSLEQMYDLLERTAHEAKTSGRNIPMIVANPDFVTVDGTDLIPMPGTLARHYEAHGGEVVLMGKPAPIIYKSCLASLGLHGQEHKVLAVGDSLEHDVAGAAAAGIDTLFIAGGIHAEELGISAPEPVENSHGIDTEALTSLCAKHAQQPTYASTYFRW